MMNERTGPELETLNIRIAMRLQRRGGRKLIVTPNGAPRATPKPRRGETLIRALVRAPVAASDREGAGAVDHRPG